jgi:hypothetical protein
MATQSYSSFGFKQKFLFDFDNGNHAGSYFACLAADYE